MILLTAMPPNDTPGAVPTTPVVRHLAEQLLSEGKRVRALVPESEAGGWPQNVDTVIGAVTEPDITPAAFGSIEAICIAGLVSFIPEKLRELANLIIRGGVKRAVILFSHGSDLETEYSPETWQWLAFEQAMKKHRIEWTYVRPTGLFGNAFAGGYPITNARWAETVRAGSPIREYRPDVATLFMDEMDVAEVIAKVLLQGGRNEEVLDIGGVFSSARERLEELSKALNTMVAFEPLQSKGEARSYWSGIGYSDLMIDVTLFIADAYTENQDVNRETLIEQHRLTELILGRPPRTYQDWLKSNIQRFR
ncbi:MAG: NAD(P)H-binding protein [Streptosporangiales bacterium]|nr:NAD(P)H-binding protein [Streptosporangiales bacterium]